MLASKSYLILCNTASETSQIWQCHDWFLHYVLLCPAAQLLALLSLSENSAWDHCNNKHELNVYALLVLSMHGHCLQHWWFVGVPPRTRLDLSTFEPKPVVDLRQCKHYFLVLLGACTVSQMCCWEKESWYWAPPGNLHSGVQEIFWHHCAPDQ